MHTTIPFLDGMDLEAVNHNSQYFQNLQNRSLIVDVHAFGSFRKDLIKNIGLERTKGFMFRYGWEMGMRDAKECKEKIHYQTIEELIKYGPVMHSMKGFVESTTRKLSIKNENNIFTLEMVSAWKNSYEADEHLGQIGISSSPVCFSLVGYASGFVTEACGQKIIFKEIYCRGSGGHECIAVGKSQSQWGNEIKEQLDALEESPILGELERTYNTLLQERDHLTTANNIYKKLTEEVVKGNNLDSIVQEVYKLTKLPVVIHNSHGYPLTSAGFSSLSCDIVPSELYQYINNTEQKKSKSQAPKMIHCQNKSFRLLTHPIYLQTKQMGYCSFMINNHDQNSPELLNMLIEKIASVCSLCFLYEKTKLDSFDPLKSLFLKEILSGHFSTEEMIAKSSLYQLDLTRPFYLGVIGYHLNEDTVNIESNFPFEVMSAISKYFSLEKQEYLISHIEQQVNIFVTNDFAKHKNEVIFFEGLIKFLYSKFPQGHFYLGVSKRTNSIKDASNAYKEALGANRMAFINKQIIFFDHLGIVGTLINENNENDVRMMAKSLLGNLDMNGQKNVEFIQTLYFFLLHGGNLEKTADELSLSISGLRYRMNKIEDLLHKDIRSPIISSQLLLAIQALIILGELKMKAPVFL